VARELRGAAAPALPAARYQRLCRAATAAANIAVPIEDEAACPRYAGLLLENVQVGPSPEWLQRRLRSIALASINNVVDVTNFVLHELGQPLHAFDADQIAAATIG
jgi:phenylalanyl-tRNA synthetase beta chain